LLGKYSKSTAPIIGTPMAGRDAADLAETVGMFVNPVFVRANIDDSARFDALLQRMHATVAEAAEHQHYGSMQLAHEMPKLGDPDRLHALLFSYHRFDDSVGLDWLERASALDLEIRRKPLAMRTRRDDLTLDVVDRRDGLQIEYRYATDRLRDGFVEHLAADYHRLLEASLQEPTQTLGALAASALLHRPH
jgi:non-ribosomal peptide synthetase component F